MNIDWTQNNNFVGVMANGVKDNYGFIHVYALTMTLGMIAAVLFSLYKFWKRGMPLNSLLMSVIFIIPISLMGASFFGKLNADGPGVNAGGANFWGLFAFWNAGMAIHGGVYAGLITGVIFFSFAGRKNKISMFSFIDAIVPNILLGQAIGRWGNFFNHEVMGAPIHKYGSLTSWTTGSEGLVDYNTIAEHIDKPLNWLHLPDWMLQNTMAIYKGSGEKIGGIDLSYGDIVQLSPIFFYESMALMGAWIIITFIIPNIGKWIGKKPWNNSKEFAISWDYTFKHFFMPWTKDESKNTWTQAWEKGFVKNVDAKAKKKYLEDIANIQKLPTNKFVKRWKSGKALIKANNPNGYVVTKSGMEGFAYFFCWNIVRYFLELSRPDDHLFIMFDKPLSLGLIMGSVIFGLIGMIITQIGVPELTRKTGYMYEKDYFKISDSSQTHKIIDNPKASKNIKNEIINKKEQKAKEKLTKLEK
ncbi:prolipoprotein diacylglyceryl transferase [Williamsoniiplasma somnilux]|uniref:Prolipoprotein diacylglyceryl transferase n=1 Tax=Williamsoniiplasma somnilux TaxID=215578 RepID=A0A2K8P0R5_9MOLU|nr:prolipoprotein diacylglyceryl transferase family protein [Williamsoniiplasma somnilux]ATZ19028.1 prolipoprotein diacylglyceryl transferase [Williamsoniiplasma somnilux]